MQKFVSWIIFTGLLYHDPWKIHITRGDVSNLLTFNQSLLEGEKLIQLLEIGQ